MKLQLVNSPLPDHMSDCLRSKCYPPLNLVSLATHVENNIRDIDIEIIDGEIINFESLINKINADIVGISSTSLSYESAVKIATIIKEKNPNCQIILGGHHATHQWKNILNNRNCFDLIVIGQGEHAFVDLLIKRPLKKISNIAFKNTRTNHVVKNEQIDIPVNSLPLPDYSKINLEKYHSNFQIHYSDKFQRRGISVFSSTGCQWRIKSGGCIYCSIPHHQYSVISAKRYWRYIQNLIYKYNIDFIWDVSDTFTSNKDWLNELVKFKPKDMEVAFHVYARIDDLFEDTIKNLKIIGVKEVLVGIESFDNEMLRSAKKGLNKNKILNILKLLNEYQINVAVSFVLGLPGESEETLKTTLDSLYKIAWMDNIIENHASILIPLPGSRIYSEILNEPHLRKTYLGKDLINLNELQKDYLNSFTICGAETVYKYYTDIDSIFKSAGPFFIDKRSPIYKLIQIKDFEFENN